MSSTSRASVPWARVALAAGWLGPWVAIAALGLWASSSPDGLSLVLAALGVTAAAVWGPRGHGKAWGAGCALVMLAILVGFVAERRVDRLVDFDGYWAARDSVVRGLLEEELNRRVESGLAATRALVAARMESDRDLDVSLVQELRARHASSALALYDPDGGLLFWDGVHRGKVPEDVQTGEEESSYHDLPLFGYLYVTSVADDESVAVAAYLLRAALPEGLGADVGDFASNFYRETGERIRITEDEPGSGEGVEWLAGRDRILRVVVDRPDPTERASQLMGRWRAGVALLTGLAWLLLALGGPARLAGATVAAGALLLLAAWLPLEGVGLVTTVFEPGQFQLPGPVPMSLGRFALLGITGFTLIGILPYRRVSLPPWAAGLVAALAFPLLLIWTEAGVVGTSLAGDRLVWIVYEVGAAALLSLFAGTLIAVTRPSKGAASAALAALVIAVLLSAGGGAWVWLTASHPAWWPALWAVPVGLAAVGAGAWSGWRRSLVGWSLAIVLGSTAAIPVTWTHRVAARRLVGVERLEGLDDDDDPRLERSLLRFGAVADSLDRAGSDDVSLLYDGWRLSGLAELGHPVWLQIWRRPGLPAEEPSTLGTLEIVDLVSGLRVGVEGREPAPLVERMNRGEEGDVVVVGEVLAEGWRAGGVRLHHLDRDDARYILTTTLANGDIASVVAPPFVEGAGRSGLGPLLRGASGDAVEPLTVIPLLQDDPHGTEDLTWLRTETGWQAEMAFEFSNGTRYHAHYSVTLPGVLLATARATLLLVMNLALFFAFWLAGQGLVRDIGPGELRLSGFAISFRARVTLALFGFFALATAVFGTVAYRTLARASTLSAQVIAARVVEDAAGWYRELEGRMERLASQVGAELLEYRAGELREGSVEELVELGLYEAWTPYGAFRLLDGREVVYQFTETSVGRWEYVTAYRRLPDGDILAAQVPLQAGTSALQTTDLIELLAFVVLVGAVLSLGLAMRVGRALTRPIHALQVASESVGAGDLGQRLPGDRTDEFGAVFRAFNRMVGRVRRAQRQLVRTSRRTQLIMDEAAVGMVALDPVGRVTLVNPRAEELLGREVFVGREIPREGPLGEALAGWLTDYLEGRGDEAHAEFQAEDRRVRVRVRRLGSSGTRRGVVVAMDDVTDELRAERVLAWGEMARQVAHEVQNPLTPIKLSIQHLRRAWEDKHPQFDEILVRNVDAMLAEIDRLAGIAQSFSRFGAPGENEAPLAEVSVSDVVAEVMALYGGPSADVRFEQDVERGLPTVVARGPELKEVLVNLLENARVAGGEGTLVSIVARSGEHDTVVLTVVDDGSGIPEDVLPRIFEPQFSTRSTGTGLGLAIVKRLVRAWGGSVSAQSVLGEGTSVSVTLRVWSDGDGSEAGLTAPAEAS